MLSSWLRPVPAMVLLLSLGCRQRVVFSRGLRSAAAVQMRETGTVQKGVNGLIAGI